MKKTLLTLLIFPALTAAASPSFPVQALFPEFPADEAAGICLLRGESEQEPTITIQKKMLRVQNAEGMTLTIYTLTGTEVETHHIDSPDKRINLSTLRPGVYLFKVGNVTRKLYV